VTFSPTDRSIDTVTPRRGNTKVNNTALRAEPVWNPEAHPGAWRAIWAYSAKRARRDQKTLAAQEARARAIVDGDKKAKSARFVKVRGDDRKFDETALARAQSLVGLKGYVTNVAASVMPAAEVIAKYHDLWARREVISYVQERSSCPAGVPLHSRCHRGALDHSVHRPGVSHCIQTRTGLSIGKVIKQLRPLRSATITNQRRHPDLPTGNPPGSARNLGPPRHRTGGTRPNVLSRGHHRTGGA